MKSKLLLFLCLCLAPVFSFAQGCITIFSEDGDRFYLVLNGVKQNTTPQTNVRVDGLTTDYYSAKILFEESGKEAISKNIPVKDPATNDFAEVTYKIKRTKDGQLKLRYFSATPVPATYNPPPDMYVMHYGQAAPPPPPVESSSTVTQTTYTTTNAAPSGASINVNGGGVNMNINVADPMRGGNGVNMSLNVNDATLNTSVSQQTTTRTTTTTSTATSDGGYSAPPPPARSGCAYPMDPSSFNSAISTIKSASFEETKLSTAKSVLSSNCISTDQVVAICKQFSFEQTKLDFAKFAYPKTTDKGNYFKVANVFDFDASKTDLNEFISH